jgi:hypothetical protein
MVAKRPEDPLFVILMVAKRPEDPLHPLGAKPGPPLAALASG